MQSTKQYKYIPSEQEVMTALKLAHDKARKKVERDNYAISEEHPRPGKDAPEAEKISWLTFAMFLEGFELAMRIFVTENETPISSN